MLKLLVQEKKKEVWFDKPFLTTLPSQCGVCRLSNALPACAISQRSMFAALLQKFISTGRLKGNKRLFFCLISEIQTECALRKRY